MLKELLNFGQIELIPVLRPQRSFRFLPTKISSYIAGYMGILAGAQIRVRDQRCETSIIHNQNPWFCATPELPDVNLVRVEPGRHFL